MDSSRFLNGIEDRDYYNSAMAATAGSGQNQGWAGRANEVAAPTGAASVIGGYAAAFTSSGLATW